MFSLTIWGANYTFSRDFDFSATVIDTSLGGSFICVFDANTYFELKEKEDQGAHIQFNRLIENLPNYFYTVPGGKRADDFILMDADKCGYPIISNDRFKDYIKKFPWIRNDQSRLIKGKTMRANIMIPDLDINIPLRNDLEEMVEELLASLSKEAES